MKPRWTTVRWWDVKLARLDLRITPLLSWLLAIIAVYLVSVVAIALVLGRLPR